MSTDTIGTLDMSLYWPMALCTGHSHCASIAQLEQGEALKWNKEIH